MKLIERLLIKLAIIHLILLCIFQFLFEHFQVMKDLQRITFYEGVSQNNQTPIIYIWKKQEERQK